MEEMMKRAKFVLLVLSILLCSSLVLAITINIPADQSTIQAGINVAVNGDTILVQSGTYVENINFNGKAITVGSLFLTTQDTTFISQTIIDGNQNGNVIFFENGEDNTSILTGFTITNGNAFYGGGIRCTDNSSPILHNLVISNNTAYPYNGGGICCYWSSNPSIENVIITNNFANEDGGGIYCNFSSPNLVNVTIENNFANEDGGGIYFKDESNLSLENVRITNNSSLSGGGGIYCYLSSCPDLEYVTIANNSATYVGGICCSYYSNPNLKNVTIANNNATDQGGGIGCFTNSIPNLANCILWNNSPPEIYLSGSSSVNAVYSDIQGGWNGEGNIDIDPLFVDELNGDYHLTEFSPCIDTGDPNLPLDPDGTIADIGAYIYLQSVITADFEANQTIGIPPFEVQFEDTSIGNPTSWQWDFENDGIIDSSEENPTWMYYDLGVYSVSLTIYDENLRDSSTVVKEAYITVPGIHNITQDLWYISIQEAINYSNDNDVIIISPGFFNESINFNGKAITLGSQFLTYQDTSFISQTIISGSLNNSVVIFENGEDSNSILTGFTITNGNPQDRGGILCQNNSNPNLSYLNIINNSGGGIACLNNSNPSISNTIIDNNTGGHSNGTSGGGIYCHNSDPMLYGVKIINNSADEGGGIYSLDSNPILENVTIEGNSTTEFGGAIYSLNCGINISNSQILNNSSSDGAELGRGGAFFISGSSIILNECNFQYNSANSHAGAIYLGLGSSADISKCSFIGNSSGGNVGGIYFYRSNHLAITNCTFYDNSGSDSGAMRFYIQNSPTDNPVILNTISWNNSPNEILCSADGLANELVIGYSDFDGGLDAIITNNNANIVWLEGNIDTDPQFVDVSNENYHLMQNSPCIDSGIAYYEYEGDILIDLSEEEYYDVAPDMGAFEYGFTGITEEISTINNYHLSNYPNPFNPSTTISFSILNDSKINLSIYNIKGQVVKTLIDENLDRDYYNINWNGNNKKNESVSSGVYFYKLNVNGKTKSVKKCILMK